MRELKHDLPNATTALAFGIISILGCFCYGVVGLTFGIIALYLSSKDQKLYFSSPEKFTETSLQTVNAGKICAIIGICISGVFIIIMGIALIFKIISNI